MGRWAGSQPEDGRYRQNSSSPVCLLFIEGVYSENRKESELMAKWWDPSPGKFWVSLLVYKQL